MLEERATGTWESPYKFNGKEIDEETGLYYVHARYRNPQHPTWLNIDPLYLKFPEVSGYVFSHGNPTSRVDMNGKEDYNADAAARNWSRFDPANDRVALPEVSVDAKRRPEYDPKGGIGQIGKTL